MMRDFDGLKYYFEKLSTRTCTSHNQTPLSVVTIDKDGNEYYFLTRRMELE
jgi:hypothetical protein